MNNQAEIQRRWLDATIVCLASGPSMTQQDADLVGAAHDVVTFTANSTWLLAPWAQVHYSNDHDWWQQNIGTMRRECRGEFWSGCPDSELLPADVKQYPYQKQARGLPADHNLIGWGGNSGFAQMQLAARAGARRIILVGYDMQGDGHWHEDHPEPIRKEFNFPFWIGHFNHAAAALALRGIEVLNASRETALKCFPRISLEAALC